MENICTIEMRAHNSDLVSHTKTGERNMSPFYNAQILWASFRSFVCLSSWDRTFSETCQSWIIILELYAYKHSQKHCLSVFWLAVYCRLSTAYYGVH